MERALSAEKNRPRRALIWSLVALGAIILVVVVLVVLQPGPGSGARQPGVVAGETPDTRFAVTGAQPLVGTNLVQIDIGTSRADYDGGSFSSSGNSGERRNILLLDRTTGAARRLLPDNGRRIAQAYFLPAQTDYSATPSETDAPSGVDAPPPAFFVLLVAQAERRDRFDLLVGSLAGPEQSFVMQAIEGVDGVWMQSPTRIGLLVRERLNLFYRIIDVPTLRVVQARRVAI
jgi:hypothetical protein